MKKIIALMALVFSPQAFAFVAGPSSVGPGENMLTIGGQFERGKIEPNENRSSYQDAKIDVQKLKYTRGLTEIFGLSHANLSAEFGQFTSNEERVGSTLFYESDKGSYLSLGFSADFLHEVDRQFGFYIQLNPSRIYNKKKFSNPRLDLYALGLTSAFNISENFFQKSLLHLGSGDGSDQNSYVAIDYGFGYRFNGVTVTTSLFVEADTNQRFDSAYDASFSPAGTQDRVRAFKYGTVVGADFAATSSLNVNFNYLQKLGGYDARATQVYTLGFGFKF